MKKGRMNQKGSMLAFSVLMFALFVVLAVALTTVSSRYFQKATDEYANEQAYLSASSVLQSMLQEEEKLISFVDSAQQGTSYTAVDNEKMGKVTLKVTNDKDLYYLSSTSDFKGKTYTMTLVLKKTETMVQTEETDWSYALVTKQDQLLDINEVNGDLYIISDEPTDVVSSNSHEVNYRDSVTLSNTAGILYSNKYRKDVYINFVKPKDCGKDACRLVEANVLIENTVIDGNLYINGNTESYSQGTHGVRLTLSNATINGDIYIDGNLAKFEESWSTRGDLILSQTPEGYTGTTYSVDTSLRITEVQSVPQYITPDIPETAVDISKNVTANTGTITLTSQNINTDVIFDTTSGKTTKVFRVRFNGVDPIITSNWKIKGNGKVVLYFESSTAITLDYNSTGYFGINNSNLNILGVKDRTTKPMMYVFSNQKMTVKIGKKSFVNAYFYVPQGTLEIKESLLSGKVLFRGAFLGSLIRKQDSSSGLISDQTYYVTFDTSGIELPKGAGIEEEQITWEVVRYE
ncbi:MAG: hypothetical protein HUJ58_05220 [Erysipelotrichaceae bacterium]|nr:hypothetical protein [Erysipelotrichaceae bacterium]